MQDPDPSSLELNRLLHRIIIEADYRAEFVRDRDAIVAAASLRPEEQARITKTQIGARILELAASGERDPVRLRNEAMAKVSACP